MALSDPLARPVWSALTTGWSVLAEGDGRALRLLPDHGPFAAAADVSPASLAALAALIPADGEIWAIEPQPLPPAAGARVARSAALLQMVAAAAATTGTGVMPDPVELGEADAPAMRALAGMTRPGPFLAATHRLGGFIGVRREGRLVAMAGERMRMDGHAEVSGVCTHPDHRGRGYAGGLMRAVADRIRARGETPFLHVYASNTGAIALYEALGFVPRRTVALTVLVRG